MAVETFYTLKRSAPALRELDDVVLLVDVASDEGVVVPAGTEGTIVGVWPNGGVFEVEFAEPIEALATVETAQLMRIGRSVS